MPKTTGPQLRSPGAVVAKSPLGRTTEPPLNIVPIFVWSPSSQTVELPSRASKGEGRKYFDYERDKDSLLVSAELVVEAIAFVMRDSDLKRPDAMPIEGVLALSL